MKRKRLYIANKWNAPIFATDIDRVHQNIFDGFNFDSSLHSLGSNNGITLGGLMQSNGNIATANNNFSLGQGMYQQLPSPNAQKPINWSNPLQRNEALNNASHAGDGIKNQMEALQGAMGNTKKETPEWVGAAKTAGLELASNIQIGNSKRGLYDALDPVYHLAGGRESGVGNAVSDAGVGVFKASAQSGNGVGMIIGAGLKVGGGLINAGWGIKTDKDKENAINTGIQSLKGFNSSADSYDDITGPDAIVDNTAGVYKGGWFSKGKARRKENNLKQQLQQYQDTAYANVANNITNIFDNTMNDLNANYAAYGGYIGDYYNNKFALGGDIQSNGSDFTTGLSYINAGGSHESNPYDGVQVGISRENGQPNMVEEGETIFDDYVYSRRILADNKTKKKFHLGKKAKLSFADISKKLEKESVERPNDPISKKGLSNQMHVLADEQERQKAEQKAKEEQETEALFNTLPPEQQEAIMQQLAMQQQAQQQQVQETQSQQEQMMQQQQEDPNAQMEQQAVEQQSQQQDTSMEQQYNAYGGKINRFDEGGTTNPIDLKKLIYAAMGFYTDRDFNDWANTNKLNSNIDWQNALENKALLEAMQAKNPVLANVIGRGYDFGKYAPVLKDGLTFDFKHGGWGKEDWSAWNGSTDAAWVEALRDKKVHENMTSQEIGDALKTTDAYKRGTEWLKASADNRLKYLQAIYNSPDAPDAAKKYAAKWVDKNGWLKDVSTDYTPIFEDPNSMGVRNTHPGTYWKTPEEILREKKTVNLVKNPDGTFDEIQVDVPNEWKNIGTYNWVGRDNNKDIDNIVNYYEKPTVEGDATKEKEKKEENPIYEPVHRAIWGRYAGLFGPAIGLGLQAMGVGKPDYRGLDAALSIANNPAGRAHYRPIGDYLGLKPLDIWYEQNRLNANSRATDRAILNNYAPIGTKMVGLIQNGYNNQVNSGDLGRKALEYDNNIALTNANYNKDTNKYNADAFTKTSATNAELQSRWKQLNAQFALDAARTKMDARASWYKGIYGNIQNGLNGLGEWGKENAQHNMIADMAADALFGPLSDKQHIGRGYIVKRIAAKGGKLNRKRGLTF